MRGLLLVSVLVVFAPALLTAAITVEGRVVNGTDHRAAAGQTVELLLPRGGMQMVGSTKTDASGRFSFSQPDLDSSAFYLLQAPYQGANYHAPVQFNSSGAATADITVFDSTRTLPPLRVRKARIVLHADGNKVHVQELFGLTNNTNPPRAYINPQGTFLFHLAAAASQMQVAVAGKLNMPLPQEPQAGETAGDFYIQYPIEPGLTVVMISYDADYQGNQFSLEDSVPYPVDYVELNVLPQNLAFDSKMFTPATGHDPETGGKRFEAVNLASNKLLAGVLSGEAPPAEASGSGEQDQTVKILPNTMSQLTLPLLACFLLILLWALGVRISKERAGTKQHQGRQIVHKQLEARLEQLLNSLADLDELFEAGKMPEKNYWKERLEMKARIVSILRKSPPALLESYASRRLPR
ncbi:MAG: hypothetical protein ACRD2O_17085 [Terriglobia bacterium]